jgi:prolipoprotein diacylglyceryltransferase
VPIAVLIFRFDPIAHLFGDLAVRWGVLALAGALFASLVLCGLLARSAGLRADDLAFIAIGAVPGAVIGGRLGYGLLHLDYYAHTPHALVDPGVGSLELGLGVVGGLLTGSYVARLLGAPVGRWLNVAATPVLLGLGLGKLTMILTGSGQGAPSNALLSTAYAGPGPWGSLAPGLPSEPSQAYEGIATLIILAGLGLVLLAGTFEQRDGRPFFIAIGAWALARAAVSLTWRDPAVALGLNAGGLIAIGIGLLAAVALAWLTWREPRRHETQPVAEVDWTDPEPGPNL